MVGNNTSGSMTLQSCWRGRSITSGTSLMPSYLHVCLGYTLVSIARGFHVAALHDRAQTKRLRSRNLLSPDRSFHFRQTIILSSQVLFQGRRALSLHLSLFHNIPFPLRCTEVVKDRFLALS